MISIMEDKYIAVTLCAKYYHIIIIKFVFNNLILTFIEIIFVLNYYSISNKK